MSSTVSKEVQKLSKDEEHDLAETDGDPASKTSNGKETSKWHPWKGKLEQRLSALHHGEKIKSNDLSSDDVIVALMGPTGSGKSSFVKAVTGYDDVGHDLQSHTSDIFPVKLTFPGLISSDIVLVDTPGFDDTYISDLEIFKMISDWLNDTYKKKIHLSGLLYFHRISDNRMAGTPLKNYRTFAGLCGNKFSNIVLTTTMWDKVDSKEIGEVREQELKNVYWKSMIASGSRVDRFLQTRQSAFQILSPLIDEVNARDALLLQKEMSDIGLALRQTSAGVTLFHELESLVAQNQVKLDRIREEMKKIPADDEGIDRLAQEQRNIAANLAAVSENMKKLKMPVGERLKKTIRLALNWNRFVGLIMASSIYMAVYKNHRVDIVPGDIIILILGLSGSGKSTFVEECTGIGAHINNDMTGKAMEITAVKTILDDRNYILVDTPGFDQEDISDGDIITRVNRWLKDLEKRRLRLTGVLYLHDVTIPLPHGKFLLSKVFLEISRSRKVVLATTRWSKLETRLYETDIQECWKDLKDAGAEVKRHWGGHQNAKDIIQLFNPAT